MLLKHLSQINEELGWFAAFVTVFFILLYFFIYCFIISITLRWYTTISSVSLYKIIHIDRNEEKQQLY